MDYLKQKYSKMHRGIVAHDFDISPSNVGQVEGMDFVFLCLDAGEGKRHAFEKLVAHKIPFTDVGMGVELVDEPLVGILRVTTSREGDVDRLRSRIALEASGEHDDYDRNIQIADLNALNAALAVVKWKKLFGFYKDLENEQNCTYTIDGNMLVNDDQP